MLSTFERLTDIQKILVTIILAVVLYGVSAGAAYTLFNKTSILPGIPSGLVTSLPGPSNIDGEDPSEPRTEKCPLDGGMHTVKAREAWEKRRPLAVMIENHQESRPQSGLSSADVVYEIIAEGGITRFMAVYYCNLSDVQVGPVRSARTYFLDALAEYDALYAHVGGANTAGPADALGQIIRYKVKDLNQFSIGYPTFWRDYQRLGHPVATEHTMYSTTEKLWAIGAKRGWTATDSAKVRWDKNFTSWTFKDDEAGGSTTTITVNFWENQSDYQVKWSYDAGCNCYRRENGGQQHTDLNTKKQLEVKNVIVQFQKESRANDGYEGNAHIIYGTVGTGKALIFQDGKVVEGKWVKPIRSSRTKFVDSKGKEISLNRGAIWIQTVPEGSKITY